MSLDFHQTCPTIDQGIANVKDLLADYLDNVVHEVNPLFYSANNGKDKNAFVESWAESLYSDIEYTFESVRETNIEMREAAEHQIKELDYELDDIKDRNSYLEEEMLRLKEDLESSQDEVSNLQADIRDLNLEID